MRRRFKDHIDYRNRFYDYMTTYESYYYRGYPEDLDVLEPPFILYTLYERIPRAKRYSYAYIVPTNHDAEAYFKGLGKRTRKNIRQLRKKFGPLRIKDFKPAPYQIRRFLHSYMRYIKELDRRDEDKMRYEWEYKDDSKQFIDFWISKKDDLRCIKVFSGNSIIYTAFALEFTENTVAVPLVLRYRDSVGTLGLFEVVSHLASEYKYVDLCETYSPYKRHLGALRYPIYIYFEGDKSFVNAVNKQIIAESRKETKREEMKIEKMKNLD